MIHKIRKVLDANNCGYELREKYLLVCVHGDIFSDSFVLWEMEVRKRLSVHGVHFKRICGTSQVFRNIVSKIAIDLQL